MRVSNSCVGTVLAFGLAAPAGAQEVRRATPPVDPVADLIATYLQKTSVIHPCPIEPTADIVVEWEAEPPPEIPDRFRGVAP